jgi:hypothetical protein
VSSGLVEALDASFATRVLTWATLSGKDERRSIASRINILVASLVGTTTTFLQDLLPPAELFSGKVLNDIAKYVETLRLLFTILPLQNDPVLTRRRRGEPGGGGWFARCILLSSYPM